MEFNFSIRRLAILLVLLVVFWLLDGFSVPLIDNEQYRPQRIKKAWQYCILLYTSGAVCISIVDHYIGTIDRSNIRLLYILVGFSLMTGSYLWQQTIRQSVQKTLESELEMTDDRKR
jgi:hypothetical protein